MNQFNSIRLRKLLIITVPISLILIALLALFIDWWRAKDSYCVRFQPNGSEQLLYGMDAALQLKGARR